MPILSRHETLMRISVPGAVAAITNLVVHFRVLGWDEDNWGQHTKLTETPFADLSEPQQEAVEVLGYECVQLVPFNHKPCRRVSCLKQLAVASFRNCFCVGCSVRKPGKTRKSFRILTRRPTKAMQSRQAMTRIKSVRGALARDGGQIVTRLKVDLCGYFSSSSTQRFGQRVCAKEEISRQELHFCVARVLFPNATFVRTVKYSCSKMMAHLLHGSPKFATRQICLLRLPSEA